ncbi:MAG: FtsQ-type POTRA domain-containing protein [Proteobacteria bacterium]|nr:FtsQ-type POTRA domain-containing protein [Pseudomonadota bacterium]
MDGGGRLTQPLNAAGVASTAGVARAPARGGGARRSTARSSQPLFRDGAPASIERFLRRRLGALYWTMVPRGAGALSAVMIIAASGAYGMVRGGHVGEVLGHLRDTRDVAANALGLRIAAIAISGNRQLSREEILATAGITGGTSLAFLDAGAARARLRANPWIADATIQKLYPDRLHLLVVERAPYALWQRQGRVAVIAADGTVLQSFAAPRQAGLPLVVGRGAETRAKEFFDLLDRYPLVRAQVRAAILVAERRWNLRLKNGVDVRLPETGIEPALRTLTKLDDEQKLLSRDIVAVDLRLADRVSVRLSDAAAQARDKEFKERLAKKKGGAA